jgi:hypothetical protein
MCHGRFGLIRPNKYHGSDYYRCFRTRNFGNSRNKGNLFQFFIKAKISIEYDSKLSGTCVHEDWVKSNGDHGFTSWAHRRYLKVIVRNTGRGVAENCIAFLTLIRSQSNAKILPSPEDKSLMWDNGEIYRTIGAKKGKAELNLVFSQEDFKNLQVKERGGHVSEDEKIYAKISTPNSIHYVFPSSIIAHAEDGLRIGDTYFRLGINTIHGESAEAIIRVTITSNWKKISLEKID